MSDISNLSIQDLKNLQAEAELLIEQKQEEAIVNAFDQINAIAEGVGLTVEELLQVGALKLKKNSRKPVQPRYRNKGNIDETWSGRGKQPRWLVAQLENGAKLEDFLI